MERFRVKYWYRLLILLPRFAMFMSYFYIKKKNYIKERPTDCGEYDFKSDLYDDSYIIECISDISTQMESKFVFSVKIIYTVFINRLRY